MNLYEMALMEAPTIHGDRCVVCGKRAQNDHHLVYRSHGGKNGPTVPLCGFGNVSGCHGAVHHNRIHFRFSDGRLEYLVTDAPVKVDVAMGMEGWVEVGYL